MARGCGLFLIGAVSAYVLALFGYIIWSGLGGVDREGALGMGIAFVYGPALALIGGILALLVLRRR